MNLSLSLKPSILAVQKVRYDIADPIMMLTLSQSIYLPVSIINTSYKIHMNL